MTMLSTMAEIPELPVAGSPAALRTMILDDSEVDRARLRRLCREADLNLDIMEAATIADFADAIGNDVFDLFLIDYRLVQGDGLIAIEMLRSHPSQKAAASVMIAGEGHIQIAVDAMKAGCNDYVLKDRLTGDVLRRVIETAISRQESIATAPDPSAAQVEAALQRFAENSGAEMRSILSSMTRRLRALRGLVQRLGANGAEVAALEEQCDRLWNYLGDYRGTFARHKGGAIN